MNEIILSTQNGEPVASSRQIAENFEKRHDHVMRDIDSFKKDVPNFGEMFFEAEAPDSYGRPQRTYLDNHVRRKVYSECNRDVQDWFRVNSVGNIPRKRFDEAVEYIQRWKPSTNTVMLIQQTNGQTSLFDRACAPAGRLIDSEVIARG